MGGFLELSYGLSLLVFTRYMALAIGEKIMLDTCFALNDGSHVLLTLSTLEGKGGALPSPLSVNNCVRLFKLKLPKFNC